MKIVKKISPAFDDFVFNWDYETYLLLGGYGSGKSYHTAFKIILKLLEERRKALVVRQVYDTIQESCYDLFCEILDEMGLLTTSPYDTRVVLRFILRNTGRDGTTYNKPIRVQKEQKLSTCTEEPFTIQLP